MWIQECDATDRVERHGHVSLHAQYLDGFLRPNTTPTPSGFALARSMPSQSEEITDGHEQEFESLVPDKEPMKH
jgi:hypothetical protein